MKRLLFLLSLLFVGIVTVSAQMKVLSAREFSDNLVPKIMNDDAKCVFLLYDEDCEYSLTVLKHLSELSYEYANIPFYKIDVTNDKWIFNEYSFKGVPSYGFVNYDDSMMYSGIFSKAELRRKLDAMFM